MNGFRNQKHIHFAAKSCLKDQGWEESWRHVRVRRSCLTCFGKMGAHSWLKNKQKLVKMKNYLLIEMPHICLTLEWVFLHGLHTYLQGFCLVKNRFDLTISIQCWVSLWKNWVLPTQTVFNFILGCNLCCLIIFCYTHTILFHYYIHLIYWQCLSCFVCNNEQLCCWDGKCVQMSLYETYCMSKATDMYVYTSLW